MGIRLSHSSRNTYQVCGRKYQLHYLERYRPVTISSPLIFGSAIDSALNVMLEGKNDPEILSKAINEFDRSWEIGQNSLREPTDMPLNPNIKYSRYDLDPDLLVKRDWADLFKRDKNFFETKNRVDNDLKAGMQWLDVPEDDRMVINYANWMSLSKKGHLLLTAYHKDILPQIKRVLAVQMNIELDDGSGNILNGVIDAVVETQDGKVIILDNKTSSQKYDLDSVAGSEQLATYYAILNIFAEDPDHSWTSPVTGAGFAVMSKKLIKDVTKVCKSCGHVATGSHKKCDAEVDGERCNGEWDKSVKFDVETQFITGNISDAYAAEVLENASVVKSCIELGLFPKNFANCADQFGSPCVFYSKCHGSSDKGLIKLPEK